MRSRFLFVACLTLCLPVTGCHPYHYYSDYVRPDDGGQTATLHFEKDKLIEGSGYFDAEGDDQCTFSHGRMATINNAQPSIQTTRVPAGQELFVWARWGMPDASCRGFPGVGAGVQCTGVCAAFSSFVPAAGGNYRISLEDQGAAACFITVENLDAPGTSVKLTDHTVVEPCKKAHYNRTEPASGATPSQTKQQAQPGQ